MKIVHFIEDMGDFGGTPRMLLYFSEYLDTREHECIFVVYKHESPLAGEIEKNGSRIINLATTNPFLLFHRFLKLLRDVRPDVVCTHFVRPVLIGLLAARLIGIPVVHNEHSSAFWRRGFSGFLSRLCLPFANKVICNSRFTANSIQSAFGVTESRIAVVYNPVTAREKNNSGFRLREQYRLGSDTMVVTHVGGMIAIRDQKTLIKGFSRLLQQVQDAALILVGDGPERTALESFTSELGLNDKVHFLGYTNAIWELLEDTDIYVNTTLEEGFGIAVVEAMMHRLPVVLSRCGAHPELIEEEVSGLFFEGGSADELGQVLVRLSLDHEKRRTLGDQAFVRSMALFQPSNYVAGVVGILEQVVLPDQAERIQPSQFEP